MKQIVLASKSPQRKELLIQAGIPFTAAESAFQEVSPAGIKPEDLVMKNAEGKAKDIAQKVKNAIVIGGDSVVFIDQEILEKPKDEKDAVHMLKKLSGNAHQVYTGYSIVDLEKNKIVTNYVVGTVYFNTLSEEDIDSYIATGEPMDKAGAYGIQGKAGMFINKVEGNYPGIVGLPISYIVQELKQFK
jgi:septum formation protein